MGMIVDMILTVTVVSITPGAVPKFQFRIGYIGAATYSTSVGVGRFHRGGGSLVRAGRGEGNRAGLFGFSAEQTACVYAPG